MQLTRSFSPSFAESARCADAIATDAGVALLTLAHTDIVTYWNERAGGYSCCVCEELAGDRYGEWERILADRTAAVRAGAKRAGRTARALDLGCGPGFFSILLARLGCAVDAVDASANMLEQASTNVARAGASAAVSFYEGDVARLPFATGSFDIVALRNVTWLMRDPIAAYREWGRVLVPGGKLLVFDANWYRYLVDPATEAQRVVDEAAAHAARSDVNGFATDDQEARCERMALSLPFTYLERPGWDVDALVRLGFSDVSADETIYKTVWSESEQEIYGSSPLFLVEATRRAGVTGADADAQSAA